MTPWRRAEKVHRVGNIGAGPKRMNNYLINYPITFPKGFEANDPYDTSAYTQNVRSKEMNKYE